MTLVKLHACQYPKVKSFPDIGQFLIATLAGARSAQIAPLQRDPVLIAPLAPR
jgi:hypothetical protein